MDEDEGSMRRILENGAAAVVTKSIGLKPRKGHPNPTCIELDHGLLNAMGLSNPGIDAFQSEVRPLSKDDYVIIGSIFGSTTKDFILLAQKMQKYGATAIELNLSCPHAKGYGLEIGQDLALITNITTAVKDATTIPVFVKLSSNVNNIVDCAVAAEHGGADAIVAINTVKAMKIDISAQTPVLGNKVGGYSGQAIKPIGIRCVYEIFEHITIPIIGCGGITNGEDAIEYIMAGAQAVQIGSALYYRNVDVFHTISDEILSWMENHNINTIKDIQGVAHQ